MNRGVIQDRLLGGLDWLDQTLYQSHQILTPIQDWDSSQTHVHAVS